MMVYKVLLAINLPEVFEEIILPPGLNGIFINRDWTHVGFIGIYQNQALVHPMNRNVGEFIPL